jgi:hypothetical protein
VLHGPVEKWSEATFLGPDSPDGESKQKVITTRHIGAASNCLRILRKISVAVEFVAINGREILTLYFSTDPSYEDAKTCSRWALEFPSQVVVSQRSVSLALMSAWPSG